jgi:hypothetical protein
MHSKMAATVSRKLAVVVVSVLVLGGAHHYPQSPMVSAAKAKAKKPQDKCEPCLKFVDGFEREFKNTEGKSSGAGNTAWEESRGMKYSSSEQRLFEILEKACGSSEHKCNSFLEENEENIEEWWFKTRPDTKSTKGIKEHLCVVKAKVCCLQGHYGSSCKKCPGGSSTPCSKHGRCKGDGTRVGSGKCSCDAGYKGKSCSKCDANYFKQEISDHGKNEASFKCVSCAEGCKDGCSGPGLENCKACNDGYKKVEKGCEDVDECAEKTFECDSDHYCSNNPGNYTCEECYTGCHPDHGCSGPAAKACLGEKCDSGFFYEKEAGCVDLDECKVNPDYCKAGTYCMNNIGSAQCLSCNVACGDEGCTSGGLEGCRNCKSGYERVPDTDTGCRDIDECSGDANPCEDPGMTCRNTKGSFECNCVPPKSVVDGKCKESETPPSADDSTEESAPKDEL